MNRPLQRLTHGASYKLQPPNPNTGRHPPIRVHLRFHSPLRVFLRVLRVLSACSAASA